MITIDSASGIIQIPKINSYLALMDKIKEVFLLNDKLFKCLYFSYIDEKEQERIRLIPQIYDEFIDQDSPKVSIGFLENVNKDEMDELMDLIESNKKRFNNINKVEKEEKFENKKVSSNKMNNIIEGDNKENEIKNSNNINSSDKFEKNDSCFNLLKHDSCQNIEKIENENKTSKNNYIQNNIKSKTKNSYNILDNNDSDNSEENIKSFENKLSNAENEMKKSHKENAFEENVQNIIESNINQAKEDIIKNIIVEASKIENKSILEKKSKYSFVHNNIRCNGCQINPIVGIRYKCIECNDFNLCEACENTQRHPHPLLKLKNNNVFKN